MFTYAWTDLLCHIFNNIMCMSPHCCVYIVPLHEGFTLIYILWMVIMGLDELTIIYRLWFFFRGIETGHIIWLCMAGIGWRAAGGYLHRFSYNNFSSLYRNLTTWFPVEGEKPYLLWVPVEHAYIILPWLPVSVMPLPVTSLSVAHAHAITSGSSTSTNEVLQPHIYY